MTDQEVLISISNNNKCKFDQLALMSRMSVFSFLPIRSKSQFVSAQAGHLKVFVHSNVHGALAVGNISLLTFEY